MKGKVRGALDWLDNRSGYRAALSAALDEKVLGGASFAYVFGSVLAFLLVLQFTTGVFLALYYSPSATDAWGSVAYLQDTVTLGWFIRGLHSHGASAIVIVAGLHLLQVAVFGAYKKPRELNWIVGVLLLGLLLAFALTGYLLPWDQTGYWATKVATGIAGTSPVVGEALQQGIQGGNEYGNLTLTRFYTIHVFLLPGALVGLTILHIALFRRHGVTTPWWISKEQLQKRVQAFWPDQVFKDMVAIALAFGVLIAINLMSHGVTLESPADPSSNFDARPEWYFRPLFQALKYFHGIWEQIVALGLPVVLGGILLMMPFVDRGESRDPRRRILYLLPLALVGFAAVALTWVSIAEDANDPAMQKRLAQAEKDAERARQHAQERGVPTGSALAVLKETETGPMRGRALYKIDCAGCHEGKELSGPRIGPGYNSRSWIRAFLADPEGDDFFGPTDIAGMGPVKISGADLDAAVEAIYAETGASDVDAALAARGKGLIENGDPSKGEDDPWNCNGCHTAFDYELEADVGPNLAKRGSRAWLAEFIGRPSHPRWFGEDNEMPDFYDKYNRAQRLDLADYLIELRSASK